MTPPSGAADAADAGRDAAANAISSGETRLLTILFRALADAVALAHTLGYA
jgi:hypothetical protein